MFSGLCLCTYWFSSLEWTSSHSPTGKLSCVLGLSEAFPDSLPPHREMWSPHFVHRFAIAVPLCTYSLADLGLHFPLDCELLEGGAVDCELFIFVSPAPRSISVEWNSCCLLIIHHIPGYFICTISNPPNSLLKLMFMLIFTGKETEAQKLSQ